MSTRESSAIVSDKKHFGVSTITVEIVQQGTRREHTQPVVERVR